MEQKRIDTGRRLVRDLGLTFLEAFGGIRICLYNGLPDEAVDEVRALASEPSQRCLRFWVKNIAPALKTFLESAHVPNSSQVLRLLRDFAVAESGGLEKICNCKAGRVKLWPGTKHSQQSQTL